MLRNETMTHFCGYTDPTHHHLSSELMQESRNWQTFSVINQTVNGFSGHMVSVAVTQLTTGAQMQPQTICKRSSISMAALQ